MNTLPLLVVIGGRELVVSNWVDVIAAFGSAAAALVALWYSHRSLQRAQRSGYADLLLRLDQEMRVHREVHLLLRPGGAWEDISGPGDIEEAGSLKASEQMPAVEAYMGLFERINFFVDEKLLELEYVEHFYGYRYVNIYCNPVIHKHKLVENRDDWGDFIALGNKLGVPEKYKNHVTERLERRKRWERRQRAQ